MSSTTTVAATENSSFPHSVETVSGFLSIHMLTLIFYYKISKKLSHKQLNKGFGGVNVSR